MKIILHLLLMIPSLAYTQTTKWEGTVDNNWHNANNWTDSIPDFGIVAIIDIGPDSIEINPGIEARAKAIEFSATTGVFKINTGGVLIIDGASNHGFINQGDVVNKGYIEIRDAINNGIQNIEKFVNQGNIYIYDVGQNAIFNSGYFLNAQTDSIDLENPGQDGFNNSGLLANYGNISVEVARYGMFNSDSIINEGTIHILSGKVNSSNDKGINNQGEIFNKGGINIYQTNLEVGLFIDQGLFKAAANSEIVIDGPSSKCIELSDGLLETEAYGKIVTFHSDYGITGSGDILNHGSIIDSVSVYSGISGNLYVENHGNITIERSDDGFVVDTLINQISGSIIIEKVFDSNIEIRVNGYLFNKGDLIVVNSPYSFYGINTNANSNIVNEGNIEISNMYTGMGIHSNASYSANSSSTLDIRNCNSGFYNNGYTELRGNIIIRHNSYGLINSDTLINKSFDIFIDSCDWGIENSGYLHEDGFSAINAMSLYGFRNTGILNISNYLMIENTLSIGLWNSGIVNIWNSLIIEKVPGDGIYNTGKIHNHSSGKIDLENIDNFGIDNSDTLVNDGEIRLNRFTNSATEYGLFNSGYVLNSGPAEINLYRTGYYGVHNTGELINDGAIEFFHCANNEFILRNAGSMMISLSGSINMTNVSAFSDLFHNMSGATFDCLGTLDIK